MANHITNYIEIRNSNPAILAEVERIFDRPKHHYDTETEALAQRVYGDEYPGEYNRSWIIDNCGAKWFHGSIDEGADDYINIQMESAWDAPSEWVTRLTERLVAIKSDIIITNAYEDEAYNFVGVHLCAKYEDVHSQIDMEKYDLDKIWDDEEARGRLYDEQYSLKDTLLDDYAETLAYMGTNACDYK